MMSTLSTENRRAQAGFTLVELAIVLVIVGLLIGGVLKGQELIAATKVNSTVSQVKALEAAAYTFKDTYGDLPGDLPSPGTRVPNCYSNAGCVSASTTALGNGQIDGVQGTAPVSGTLAAATIGTSGTESTAYFNQLYAGNLISGLVQYTSNPTAALTPTISDTVLGAPLDNKANWRIGFNSAAITGAGGTSVTNTHYMSLTTVAQGTAINAAATGGNIDDNGILVKQAGALDSKLDDGSPVTGSVRGLSAVTASSTTGCINGSNYNTQDIQKDCGVIIQVLQ